MQMIAARRDRAMPSVRSSAVMPRTHDPRSTLPPILQTVPCARTRPRRRISQYRTCVTPEQREAMLIQVVGHLCTMSLELTQEANRLSVALARRSGMTD